MSVISDIKRFFHFFLEALFNGDMSKRFDSSLATLSLEFVKTHSPARYLMLILLTPRDFLRFSRERPTRRTHQNFFV